MLTSPAVRRRIAELGISLIGYGDLPVYRASPRRESRSIPADTEPRVSRSPKRERQRAGMLSDVDVPEFIPRG